jgi:acyltransferase
MDQTSSHRIEWADNFRGFLILLVVLGHTPIWPELRQLIYAVHMPAFFFVSGIFFFKSNVWRPFLTSKLTRLILPYAGYASLSYLVWLLIRTHSRMAMRIEPWQPVAGSIYGVNEGSWLSHNPALWFLPCLFITQIFLYLLPEKTSFRFLYMAALAALGWLCTGLAVRLPWSIDCAFSMALFASVGYLYAEHWKHGKPWPLTWIIGLLALNIGAAYLNTRIDVAHLQYGNYFLFLLAALSGCLAMIQITKRIKSIRLLHYLGRESLSIFGLHFLIFLLLTGLSKKLLHYPLFLTYENLVAWNSKASVAMVALIFLLTGVLGSLLIRNLYCYLKELLKPRLLSLTQD